MDPRVLFKADEKPGRCQYSGLFAVIYDVQTLPTVYLLDKDKKDHCKKVVPAAGRRYHAAEAEECTVAAVLANSKIQSI